MNKNNCHNIYQKLKAALENETCSRGLQHEKVSIRCSVLTAEDAIGNPEDKDYPIIKGREKMIEAVFRGSQGQVFTDEYGNAEYTIEEVLNMDISTNRKRAEFIASLNAIFRHLGLCKNTIHCRDAEPRECAGDLHNVIAAGEKILLVGCQPRFLEFLAKQNKVRVVDLDMDNIGSEKFGVKIEPPENTSDAIEWCDMIFATGSTIVNCTIGDFLNKGKPVIFYGVTISAAARILGLTTYCSKGH